MAYPTVYDTDSQGLSSRTSHNPSWSVSGFAGYEVFLLIRIDSGVTVSTVNMGTNCSTPVQLKSFTTGGTTSAQCYLYHCTFTSSGSASPTFTTSASTPSNTVGISVSVPVPSSGIDADSGPATGNSTVPNSTNNNFTWGTGYQNLALDMVWIEVGNAVTATPTEPSLYNLTVDLAHRIFVAEREETSGAENPGAWVINNSAGWAAFVVGIQGDAINTAPTANAGPDQTGISEGETVDLDGTSSSDPEQSAATLDYAWTVINAGGTGITNGDITDRLTSTPFFTAPNEGLSPATIVIRLTVTDDGDLTDTDDISITVAPYHEETASGGVEIGGVATVEFYSPILIQKSGAGGALVGGTADLEFETPLLINHVGSGGLRVGGDAGFSAATFHPFTGSGGLKVGGTQQTEIIYNVLGPFVASYIVEIDKAGDGSFDVSDEVTADTLTFEALRGRDYPSQLIGRSTAGRLNITLRNTNGEYSPFVNELLPGVAVRVRATYRGTTRHIWNGELTEAIPEVQVGPFILAQIVAEGRLWQLSTEDNITIAPQQLVGSGLVVSNILDEVGISSSNYDVDSGESSFDHWWVEDRNALDAIRDVETAELGFLYEEADGTLRFESRHARFNQTRSYEVQLELSDDPNNTDRTVLGYNEITEHDPLREIFNRAKAAVQSYTTGSEEVLWTLDETPLLEAGESLTVWAEASSDAAGDSVAYVFPWSTPVVGTDITQSGVTNGDIGVSVSKFAQSMKITITNNHGSSLASLTLVQAKGVPVILNEPTSVQVDDTPSQTDYGIRTFELDSPWLMFGEAQGYVNFVVERYKERRPILTVSFVANKSPEHMEAALDREISDLIRVIANNNSELGIEDGFHIEAIHHRIEQGGLLHTVTWELALANPDLISDGSGDPGVWQLGVSTLGNDTTLASF